jgi:hypothetical protein
MLKWTVQPDNAPAHNSKRSRQAVEAAATIRMPYPAYSPDRAPGDLYLIGNLKEKLQSVAVTDRDGPISATREMFSDIPQDKPIAIHENSMKQFL